MAKLDGTILALGVVGAVAVAGAFTRRGSASRLGSEYDPIRALGYSDEEIAKALAAAGKGPTALQRGVQQDTAGPTRQGEFPGLDFVPPPAVRAAALKGLRLRKVNEKRGKRVDPRTGAGPGAWWIGVGRAIQLAIHPSMPPREIPRMAEYFRRHDKDQFAPDFGNDQRPSNGYVAWLAWGGQPGAVWARELREQMERSGKKRKRGSRAIEGVHFVGTPDTPRFVYLQADGRPNEGAYIIGHIEDAESLKEHVLDEAWPSNEEHGMSTDPAAALQFPKDETLGYVSWLETAIRGRGEGRRLWEAMRTYLREQGVRHVYTTASPNAVPYWQRMGFVVHPWSAGYLTLMHQRI